MIPHSLLRRIRRKLAPAAEHAPAPPDLSPFLGRKLVVADVGCRWGFAEAWAHLHPNVTLFGFDPDAAECERLRPFYEGRDVTLVPQALADAAGRRTLYLTREPACSSLYPPDPSLTATMPGLACATQTGTAEVQVTTLDRWAAAAGVGAVDFVKLDTQGSELDILRGGEGLLRTVRAVEVEVEFNPIYLGQPLFGDVDRFLRDRGFVLWRLTNMVHYARGAQPADGREEVAVHYDARTALHADYDGQFYWGQAHYVRAEVAAASVGDWRQAVRDAALARVFGFTDLAGSLLRAAAANGGPAALLPAKA
jgi:FkbM family methyltransferase